MSATAIHVENLAKRYAIGKRAERYTALRDVIAEKVGALFRRRNRNGTQEPAEIWALHDVSFEVREGEAVGIIGRNGAGKSTLLKILSRVTEPTRGRVTIRGRVASLLEVGTGFHPELTGRENIYLNGAILGMRKAEIRRRFDEIVAFAEIERFLDTPVKHYSSGMYMRLAFAVAAHLDPEILLVDEVLAVGDALFQKKCMGKMDEVARRGRTVLFVSHNMAAIQRLCRRGVLLHEGGVEACGELSEVISRYLCGTVSHGESDLRRRSDRHGSGEVRFTELHFRDEADKPIEIAIAGSRLGIHLGYEVAAACEPKDVFVRIEVVTEFDVPVFVQTNRLGNVRFDTIPKRGRFICELPRLPLPAGSYRIKCGVMPNGGWDDVYYDFVADAGILTVVEGDFFGCGDLPPIARGVCLVDAAWRLQAE